MIIMRRWKKEQEEWNECEVDNRAGGYRRQSCIGKDLVSGKIKQRHAMPGESRYKRSWPVSHIRGSRQLLVVYYVSMYVSEGGSSHPILSHRHPHPHRIRVWTTMCLAY